MSPKPKPTSKPAAKPAAKRKPAAKITGQKRTRSTTTRRRPTESSTDSSGDDAPPVLPPPVAPADAAAHQSGPATRPPAAAPAAAPPTHVDPATTPPAPAAPPTRADTTATPPAPPAPPIYVTDHAAPAAAAAREYTIIEPELQVPDPHLRLNWIRDVSTASPAMRFAAATTIHDSVAADRGIPITLRRPIWEIAVGALEQRDPMAREGLLWCLNVLLEARAVTGVAATYGGAVATVVAERLRETRTPMRAMDTNAVILRHSADIATAIATQGSTELNLINYLNYLSSFNSSWARDDGV